MRKTPIQINLRKLMGDMSEGELSRKTNVSQTTIHRILTGEIRESKPSTIKPIADYFGLTIAELSDSVIGHISHDEYVRRMLTALDSAFNQVSLYMLRSDCKEEKLEMLEKIIKLQYLHLSLFRAGMLVEK